ncbi:MAG TPA: nitrite reductase small subunit NirD [Candidatus Solibacter sp.]|nr:nitrite reductase small subunit NirD [Candidatus Solibacter sp.]
MSWIRVTEIENIPLREGRAVQIGDREIAIFNLGGRVLAADNACPHRGGPLADGIVSGTHVVCPLHAYRVCLESGNVTKPEVCVKVDTYEVRVEGGVVMVDINEAEEKAA